MYLVPVLLTFYIQGVLKVKKNNSGAKRLSIVIKQKGLSMKPCCFRCICTRMIIAFRVCFKDIGFSKTTRKFQNAECGGGIEDLVLKVAGP